MLLVHRFGMTWINESPDVIGADHFCISHRLDWLDGCGRDRPDDELWARSARGDEHERDECEGFHGWNGGVEGDLVKIGADLSSAVKTLAEPATVASAPAAPGARQPD